MYGGMSKVALMLLTRCKKSFAILCLVLASSSYAADVPTDIHAMTTPQTIAVTHLIPMTSAVLSSVGHSDDPDIKEAREEESPVRDSRPLRTTRPK
ncbi:hypothetical protein D9K79_12415 [Acinetobacter cumulans]|jgi:hypothetical protein|uniref:Uncharacterized protein n=2 Tax=Moraxellaceae TaxID=468 RepID=A0A498CTY4_9GAMM|nr:hypothetical protein DYI81_14305 [Acinetobacter sp. SWAC5]RKG42209.1 hypothetical protein D7V51_12645 [Acinetobacter cumulans]RKG46544.1 hypothetical protein D7V68_13895 [Acinetobacter cumulans]RLL33063.1 hypothetical protein D9K80_13450 [Acinetobacter cumulans]RLL41969.1 hypothetical protein D9K79_12415 [Acinetobacter cumulans]